MKILISLILFLSVALPGICQPPAHVDKKSKEFIIPPNSKIEYNIIGYQFPNQGTKKMICFSTNSNMVRENDHECALGAYFDTNHLKEGDMIYYLGQVGSYAKMNFVQGNGKKTVFYILKSNLVIK
jgi:hypothetical protein